MGPLVYHTFAVASLSAAGEGAAMTEATAARMTAAILSCMLICLVEVDRRLLVTCELGECDPCLKSWSSIESYIRPGKDHVRGRWDIS